MNKNIKIYQDDSEQIEVLIISADNQDQINEWLKSAPIPAGTKSAGQIWWDADSLDWWFLQLVNPQAVNGYNLYRFQQGNVLIRRKDGSLHAESKDEFALKRVSEIVMTNKR